MKKKTIALFGFAAVSALALAGCKNTDVTSTTTGTATTTAATTTAATTTAATTTDATTTSKATTSISTSYAVDTKGLDIALNYSGKQGVSMRQTEFVNTVDGVTYMQNDILPTFKYYAAQVNTTIREATNYADSKDDNSYKTMDQANYMSLVNTSEYVDLFYNSTKNFKTMYNAGKAVNLMSYINAGKMPYLQAFLEDNNLIEQMISVNYGTEEQAIYYTPYFDGYNAVERMLIMDTNMTKAVLDVDSFANFDTTINGASADTNVLQAAKYQPFMDANYNLPETENFTIEVSDISQDTNPTITLAKTTNIIKQQNELLAAGCTGKQLAEQFAAYIDTVYADGLSGENKVYDKRSDVFCSEAAAYNCDELIALMRVIKANPGIITGDPDAEIELLCPRGENNSRIDNIMDFMQIWGVQGMDNEDSMLFFDADGKIADAGSYKSTYDGLKLLSQIYDEGLILNNFYIDGSLGATDYLNKYFGKTVDNGGYGFMLYDYSASTGAVNSKDEDGVGTDDATRVDAFKNTSVTGVMPVVTPLSYWQNNVADNTQSLADHTNKTLMRYAESNRALKGNSWCIPSSSDNIETAVALMDFLYSPAGKRANDFATATFWDEETFSYSGETTPQFNAATKAMIASSGEDFWSFLRGYLGSTHGIGYVRSKTINYLATNKYAKIGTANIESAISTGAIKLAVVSNENAWGNSVPNGVYSSPSDTSSYSAVTAFFASDKLATSPIGWVYLVKGAAENISETSTTTIGQTAENTDYSYSTVYTQAFTTRVTSYLYNYISSYDSTLIPAYAQIK